MDEACLTGGDQVPDALLAIKEGINQGWPNKGVQTIKEYADHESVDQKSLWARTNKRVLDHTKKSTDKKSRVSKFLDEA